MSAWQSPPPPPPPPPFSYGAPPRRGSTGPAIVAIFIGILLAVGLIGGLVVLFSTPLAPEPPCLPGQACAPRETLPPVADQTTRPQTPGPLITPRPRTPPPTLVPGQTPVPLPTAGPPTPASTAAPVISGTLFRSETLDYSFEYSPRDFSLADSTENLVVLDVNQLDARVFIAVEEARMSPRELLDREIARIDERFIGRIADDDPYDALLGPSIGYVDGEGDVYQGTILGTDGTPVAPGGLTVVASTNGRLTVAILVFVGSPDQRFGSHTAQHIARSATDDILKTFNWGGGR